MEPTLAPPRPTASGLPPILAALSLGLLSGCSLHAVNPDPTPPLTAPAQFSRADPPSTAGPGHDLRYSDFGDERLAAAIDRALQENLDLRAASARLAAAQALLPGRRAALLPQVDAGVDGSRRRNTSGNSSSGFDSGLSFAWEIDLFHRLRAQLGATRAERDASAEDLAALQRTLSAEVALAWYGALAQHRQRELLRAQAALDGEFLALIELRYRQGIGTQVEVLQQRGQLAATQTLVPLAEARARVFENRLDVLLGQIPDGRDRLGSDDRFPDLAAEPPLGLPSQLLLNRPDLRALRQRLVARDHEIGVAIAERLPQLTLNGTYVYRTAVDATASTLLGSLLMPLLDWGDRRARITRNQALYGEQLAAFGQAFLGAIEEVENAYYQASRQRDYLQRLHQREAILKDNLAQARAVYTQGLTDYLPVLEALQQLREVERSLIDARYELVARHIELLRAQGIPQPTEG